MDLPIFDQVGELVRTMVNEQLGAVHYRAHRGGVKVWLGDPDPPREHYEAQFIPRHLVDASDGAAIEVGFHAENRDPAANKAVLDKLVKQRKKWAKKLGPEAEAGGFLGRPDDWCRVSEAWLEFDFEDPDMAFELASRVVDYVEAIEPLR